MLTISKKRKKGKFGREGNHDHSVSHERETTEKDQDGSKEHHEEHHEQGRKSSDDEGFDLKTIPSALSSFFLGEGDASVYKSLNSVYDASVKFAPILIVLLLMFLGGYVRATPAWLPIAEEWAQESIDDQLRMQIAQNVEQEFPNLPPENFERMVEEQLQEFREMNSEAYEAQIAQGADFLRGQLQDDEGQTFLTGIDPYHWYRLSRNVIERGGPGDEVRDGEEWDALMLAPYGRAVDTDAHIFTVAHAHRVITTFFPDVSLMTTAFYSPVVLAPLAVIPAFFIVKKFAGIVGGTVAGFFVAIHPSFVSRAIGGFNDNDSYTVVLPLFAVWFLIEALYAKTVKKTAIFSGLTVLSLYIFYLAWEGWWYIFLIISAALGIYLLWLLFLNTVKQGKPFKSLVRNKESRRKIVSLVSVFLGAIFFTGLIDGFRTVTRLFWDFPMRVIQIRDVATLDIWPNVLTTVAELNPSAHMDIITNLSGGPMGGRLIFALAFMGAMLTLVVWKKEYMARESAYLGLSFLIYLIMLSDPDSIGDIAFGLILTLPVLGKMVFNMLSYPAKDIKDIRIPYAAIIIVWLASTVYASTRGVRFIMVIVPAFSLGLGIFAGVMSRLISDKVSTSTGMNKKAVSLAVGLLVVSTFLLGPLNADALDRSVETARNYVPHMNDVWYQGLQGIDETAEEDAIIGSWWDFGHWFKAIAQRPVFFDGGSQSTNTAHWIGKTLVTEDETLAAGLLRKMTCGRDEAYDYLEEESPLSGPEAVDMIYDIVRVNTDEARSMMLDAGVPEDVAENVLEYTHCDPREVFFITSEDMVGKGGVWGHFGSWDFHRAEQYMMSTQLPREEAIDYLVENHSYEREDAESTYTEISTTEPDEWISPWPGYMGAGSGCSRENDDEHLCRVDAQGQQLNILFNETSGDAHIIGNQPGMEGDVRPAAISYLDEDDNMVTREYEGSQVQQAFSFVREGSSYNVILMDPIQVDSMFTQLFFHEGEGVDYFESVYDEQGIVSGRVVIWEIHWMDFLEDIDDVPDDFDYDEPEDIDYDADMPVAEEAPQQPQQPQQPQGGGAEGVPIQ